MPGCHRAVCRIGQPFNQHLQSSLHPGSNHMEGKEKYQSHDSDKTGNCCVFSGKNTVNFSASDMLFAFLRFYDRFFHQIFNKVKTHFCDCCRTVKPSLFLHLGNDMSHHLLLILRKIQFLQNHLIALHQLRGSKSNRNSCCLRMVLNQMHDSMQTSMYRTIVLFFSTEIRSSRAFLILCHMHGMTNQFFHAFIFGGSNRNNGNSKHFLHFIDSYGATVTAHLIHHI